MKGRQPNPVFSRITKNVTIVHQKNTVETKCRKAQRAHSTQVKAEIKAEYSKISTWMGSPPTVCQAEHLFPPSMNLLSPSSGVVVEVQTTALGPCTVCAACHLGSQRFPVLHVIISKNIGT